MEIERRRLRADLESTGEFGAISTDDSVGRTAFAGSEENGAARDYFVRRAEDRGLDVSVDAVGNIAARWTPPSADSSAPAVATGSHLDSVPKGGIFDGPLGVYAGLESIRAMQDAGIEPHRPVQVVCFTEEEGQRFANGLLGSSVACGDRTVEDALALTDDDGTSLETALKAIGYRGSGRLDAADWDSWLELHVEQGTRLESAGAAAGIVSTISGITHCYVAIEGETDHAGSTPMDARTDALTAAGELVVAVEDRAHEALADGAEAAVATVGSVEMSPNATNVVPGRVELGIDVRDVDGAVIESLVESIRADIRLIADERGVETSFSRPYANAPTTMTGRCREALQRGSERAGVRSLTLHSGAAHDTMNVASVTDSGLLFAPSRDGISHSPAEWTDWADCADATRVLARALADLATAV